MRRWYRAFYSAGKQGLGVFCNGPGAEKEHSQTMFVTVSPALEEVGFVLAA